MQLQTSKLKTSEVCIKCRIRIIMMPTCDVLLHHFTNVLLYMMGYSVAYIYLLNTMVIVQM